METKGLLQSKTVLSLAILAVTSLGQLLVENSSYLQTLLEGFIPTPWNALVAPAMSFLVVLVTLLGVKGRKDANPNISGLWK